MIDLKQIKRSIIFGDDMIRATLEGSKSQTRRIVKDEPTEHIKFPYKKGDIVRVKEVWRDDPAWGCSRMKPSEIPPETNILYRATMDPTHVKANNWRHVYFMPKWASRLFIEVTDIKREKLQDISLFDARAEGAEGREEFQAIWDSKNAKRGFDWNSNPLVWKICFELAWVKTFQAKNTVAYVSGPIFRSACDVPVGTGVSVKSV